MRDRLLLLLFLGSQHRKVRRDLKRRCRARRLGRIPRMPARLNHPLDGIECRNPRDYYGKQRTDNEAVNKMLVHSIPPE